MYFSLGKNMAENSAKANVLIKQNCWRHFQDTSDISIMFKVHLDIYTDLWWKELIIFIQINSIRSTGSNLCLSQVSIGLFWQWLIAVMSHEHNSISNHHSSTVWSTFCAGLTTRNIQNSASQDICEENPLVNGRFPSQRVIIVENISMSLHLYVGVQEASADLNPSCLIVSLGHCEL